ncbi:MAG: biopolymer transporter ExbD [Cyclobacteriaceae bacterium]|nr:biopolymer transporter ExbD [Cyclobacteriaceae bacterium]
MKTTTQPEMPLSSMADIAFLLLTFFLVTTQIDEDKGLTLLLPPGTQVTQPVHDRNLFTVYVNANGEWLIEGQLRSDPGTLPDDIRAFILNQGNDSQLSESPEKAVVSYKTDRSTPYAVYLHGLDLIQSAYYSLYAERAGMSAHAFRALDANDPVARKIYEEARRGIPMNLSLAEPSGAISEKPDR